MCLLFTLLRGRPPCVCAGACDSSERYALWEIPLWSVEDASKNSIASMDPDGNAYDNYKRELEWRLAGNRAPLGLFFHAGEAAPLGPLYLPSSCCQPAAARWRHLPRTLPTISFPPGPAGASASPACHLSPAAP